MAPPLKAHEKHAILFLLRHLGYGVAGAVTLGLVLLASDIGGLRSLAFASDDGGLAIAVLFFGLFITCGSVAMGIGIMAQGRDG